MTPEGGDCTKPKATLLNEGVIVDVTCTSKDGKQTISTAFTGDFVTRYHAILKTSFDPPIGALNNMGVIIDGKYLGPECADGAPKQIGQRGAERDWRDRTRSVPAGNWDDRRELSFLTSMTAGKST